MVHHWQNVGDTQKVTFQCLLRFTVKFSPYPSILIRFRQILQGAEFGRSDIYSKVHIFWEGHKILRNPHLTFDWHYTWDKSKVKILQNFVAYSEYMNFKKMGSMIYFVLCFLRMGTNWEYLPRLSHILKVIKTQIVFSILLAVTLKLT